MLWRRSFRSLREIPKPPWPESVPSPVSWRVALQARITIPSACWQACNRGYTKWHIPSILAKPGSVYLKAFEVTKGTPLSVDRLEQASKTRMTWSTQSVERFGARAGFTIYEGDWGKPYAARSEVSFKPDSGKAERKLAERIFKI